MVDTNKVKKTNGPELSPAVALCLSLCLHNSPFSTLQLVSAGSALLFAGSLGAYPPSPPNLLVVCGLDRPGCSSPRPHDWALHEFSFSMRIEHL